MPIVEEIAGVFGEFNQKFFFIGKRGLDARAGGSLLHRQDKREY
jgi:hypothetical protein